MEPDTDCNDTNAAIHPGATEICNGIDDNCNMSVDEGLSGETYVGNVFFTTQAEAGTLGPLASPLLMEV
ncbi:MAG: putative metal-binding motif-containing protein [Saprospiraceae bacterium]